MNKLKLFPKLEIRDITILGLLIALAIINGRILSFEYPPGQTMIKITISFIVALVAITYGPIYGAMFGGIVDLIGFSMFGVGIYHPGFTLSAMVAGLIPGLIYLAISHFKIKFDFTYISIILLTAIIPFSIYYTYDRADNGNLDETFAPILTGLFIASAIMMIIFAIVASIKIKDKSKYPFDKVFAAVIPAKMIVSFVLNPIWLSNLYGNAYIAYLPLRFITFPISTILSILVLYIVLNRFAPIFNKKSAKK